MNSGEVWLYVKLTKKKQQQQQQQEKQEEQQIKHLANLFYSVWKMSWLKICNTKFVRSLLKLHLTFLSKKNSLLTALMLT